MRWRFFRDFSTTAAKMAVQICVRASWCDNMRLKVFWDTIGQVRPHENEYTA